MRQAAIVPQLGGEVYCGAPLYGFTALRLYGFTALRQND
jgi:hypothetical protein